MQIVTPWPHGDWKIRGGVTDSQAFLAGKEWSAKVMVAAYEKLAEDLPLPPDVPGELYVACVVRSPPEATLLFCRYGHRST